MLFEFLSGVGKRRGGCRLQVAKVVHLVGLAPRSEAHDPCHLARGFFPVESRPWKGLTDAVLVVGNVLVS